MFVHFLDLEGPTACFIERFRTRLSEFQPYFSILQRIDTLVLSRTTLQIRHYLWIGSADELSRTGEIWQFLGALLAMPLTELNSALKLERGSPMHAYDKKMRFSSVTPPLDNRTIH